MGRERERENERERERERESERENGADSERVSESERADIQCSEVALPPNNSSDIQSQMFHFVNRNI